MRCYICNGRCEGDLCPKCAAARAWAADPVAPKFAPIPEFHEVPKNNAMAMAFTKVLGRKAKI